MAQRIALPVLGATLAPYSSNSITPPVFQPGNLSESWHEDVSQLQRGIDTTQASRALYPLALSTIKIKFVNANHFQTITVYLSITAAGVDGLANM